MGNVSKKIDITKVEYTALFVSDPLNLLSQFPARHDKVFAHHSTIWYKPTNLDDLQIGEKSMLKIIGYIADERCFAVLVENSKSKNRFPHITISCTQDTGPVYSNELLENAFVQNNIRMLSEPIFIDVVEGYKNTSGEVVV